MQSLVLGCHVYAITNCRTDSWTTVEIDGFKSEYFVGLYILFYGFYKIFQRDCWFFELSGLTTFQSANPFHEKIPSSYATRSLERHSARMLS